jgi:chromosome segregation ATPase
MGTKVALSQEDAMALIAKSLDQGNVRNALAIVGDMMDSANSHVATLRARVQSLEGELAAYEARRGDLMARYTAMRVRTENVEEAAQKLQEQVAEGDRVLDIVTRERQTLAADNARLSALLAAEPDRSR